MYCIVHGTLLSVMWKPGWEGNLGETGYMYMYGWVPLLFIWSYYNIVNWLGHWKDWCWSWSSNTLAPWCKELTHWKRPRCWDRLRAGGEGDDRGWDGWMAYQLDRHEFEQTLGVGDGQGGLACCGSWGRKELDTTEWLNWTEQYKIKRFFVFKKGRNNSWEKNLSRRKVGFRLERKFMDRKWGLNFQAIEVLGEAHWLKPPTLARHHSNHLHELF